MKKIFAAIIALSVCGAMLTACGNNSGENTSETTASQTDAIVSDSTDETEAASSEGIAAEEEVFADENTDDPLETVPVDDITDPDDDEAETETEPENTEPVQEEEIVFDDSEAAEEAVGTVFDSEDDFLSAEIFTIAGEKKAFKDSLSSAVISPLAEAKSFCLEMNSADGEGEFSAAVSDGKIMMKGSFDPSNDMVVTIIIKDSTMYMLDDAAKLALFIEADESIYEQYSAETIIAETGLSVENAAGKSFVSSKITIGKTDYIFEYEDGANTGILFKTDGTPYAIINSSGALELSLCEFKLSTDIPSDTFDIPDDYQRVDMGFAPDAE